MSHNQTSVPISSAIMGPQKQNSIYRKCQCCVNACKWIPVLFITCVLLWGYYAYVYQLCLMTMESVILKIICLIVFHILYVLTFWSYWQTIFTKSAAVPRNFWFTFSDYDKLQKETTEEAKIQVLSEIISSRQLPVICRTYTGNYRLCEKCNLIKPDRAHHCSVCGRCVLKMDHHCPWVNNCVCYSNYKFFVLFLGYAFFLCLFAASTSFYYFLKSWQSNSGNWGKFHILFLFFVSIMFAISLVSLFGYHIYLVLLNRSTLESFRAPVFSYGPDKNAFNLGKYHNFCQIFGLHWKSWFLPISTSVGDGVHYPINIREEHVQDLQSPESVENVRQNDVNQQTQILSPTHKQTNFYNSIAGHSDNNSGQWSSTDVVVPMPAEESARLVTEPKGEDRQTKVGGDNDVLVPI